MRSLTEYDAGSPSWPQARGEYQLGDTVLQFPINSHFPEHGWKLGGDGQSKLEVADDHVTIRGLEGAVALYGDFSLPRIEGKAFRFSARVRSSKARGVTVNVFADGAFGDTIPGLRDDNWYDLAVTFQPSEMALGCGGTVRLYIWVQSEATVSISSARVEVVSPAPVEPPVDDAMVMEQVRSPILSDDEWHTFISQFKLNPREAHSFLNKLEISRGAEISYSWAHVLQFSLTDLCNIMCRFCGQTQFAARFNSQQYSVNDVSAEKIHQAFGDVRYGYPYYVDFSGDGEPLIHDGFRELVKVAREKFPYSLLRTCSNGLALTRNMAEFLANSRLHWLNISLNAATAESWERTTGNPNFNKVVQNIRYLQQYKARSLGNRA